MSRFPRSARGASVKCIQCNAPATDTTDGDFVCVSCGNTVVRRKGTVEGPRAVTARDPDSSRPRTRDDVPGPSTGSNEDADSRSQRDGPARRSPSTDGGVLQSVGNRPTVDPQAPAVGVIATPGDDDAVIRTVARAVDHGHEVLLTYRHALDPEMLGIVRSLGATIVDPHNGRDDSSLRAVLESAGRDMSLPGILVQTEPFHRIDYERSVLAFDPDDYLADVIPERDGRFASVVTVIPAYNEADTIAEVVRGVATYSETVIVVDDGSVDGTRERAEDAGATVVRHRRNRGYGAALRSGFKEASARSTGHLVVIDGDAQHDPEDIPRLLSALDDRDADVVIGSRFVDGAKSDVPRYRRFGIKVINVLTNLSIGVFRPSAFIRDTQSGFRVYRSEVVEALADAPSISDDMEASVQILYHLHHKGYRIEEVGTSVDYTVENPSSRNPVAHGYDVVKTLIHTIERDRPLSTLGLTGLLSLSAGLGLVVSLATAGGVATATAPAVVISASVLLAIGIVASLSAAVLHGFNLNREFLQR